MLEVNAAHNRSSIPFSLSDLPSIITSPATLGSHSTTALSMKITLPAAVVIAGSLAHAIADQQPVPESSNISVASGSNSTVQGCAIRLPRYGLKNWYYGSKAEGPYTCTTNHDASPWAMLANYRSGGTQGVHWKYTDDPNDSECLSNWEYSSSDGQTIIDFVVQRTTFSGDTRRWCGLPVYRSGGVVGKQWNFCSTICDSEVRT